MREQKSHHCYLLESLSSRRTYIGYTVKPTRRIKQHNGEIKGGAVYTSRFRPWKFVAIVHGFGKEKDGLRFEWAWQHPKRSRIFRKALTYSSSDNREDDPENSATSSTSISDTHVGDNDSDEDEDEDEIGIGMTALAGAMEKEKGPMGKLRLLMVLLCGSSYRSEHLDVYFLEEENKQLFETLFASSSSQHDDNQWYTSLPPQMNCYLVHSPHDIPLKGGHDSNINHVGQINDDHVMTDDNGDDDDDESTIDLVGRMSDEQIMTDIQTDFDLSNNMQEMSLTTTSRMHLSDSDSDVVDLLDNSNLISDKNNDLFESMNDYDDYDEDIEELQSDSNSTIDMTCQNPILYRPLSTTPQSANVGSVIDLTDGPSLLPVRLRPDEVAHQAILNDNDTYCSCSIDDSSQGTIDLCSP